MPLNNTAKNLMLTQLAGVAGFMSLHTGYPATGGNEIAGGSPAYARKPITWGAAANGAIAATNQPVFDVPSGVTVAAVVSGALAYLVALSKLVR